MNFSNKKRKHTQLLTRQSFQIWKQNGLCHSLQAIINELDNLIVTQSLDCAWSIEIFNRLAEQSLHQDLEWPIRFKSQGRRMGGEQYLQSILSNEGIPLKIDQNHDILNAFMWLALPKTRWICAQYMQYASTLRSVKTPKKRSKLEDRITIFDESGIAIFSDQDDLLELVRARAWKTLFWQERARCETSLKMWIVGHGLYEQLLTPFIGLVGYGRTYPVSSDLMRLDRLEQNVVFDHIIAEDVQKHCMHHELPLSAIPILGYPGWWSAQDESFYNQVNYFRGPYPKAKS